MKSVFLFVMTLSAGLSLKGDVLCWLVDNENLTVDGQSSADSGFNYTYAGVSDTTSGKYLCYVDEEGETWEGDWMVDKESFDSGSVYAFANSEMANHEFQVELFDDNGKVAYSISTKFDDLLKLGYITSYSFIDPGATRPVWTVSAFSSVPEPTTGLLVLFGLAGLALKRKG